MTLPNNETAAPRQRQQRRRRRRPSCCIVPAATTAAIALVVVAFASSSASSFFVLGAHPPSIHKKATNNNKKKHGFKIRGSAMVAGDGAIPLRDTSNNGNGNRVVIVQPPQQHDSSSLPFQQHAHVASNYRQQTELHPWPHPDTFAESSSAQQQQNQQHQQRRQNSLENPPPAGNADWAGDRQLYGNAQEEGTVEYYQNDQALQLIGQDNNDDNVSVGQSRMSSGVHVASYLPEHAPVQGRAGGQSVAQPVRGKARGESSQMDYQEWLQNQGQNDQQPYGQAADGSVTNDESPLPKSKLSTSPLEDLDVVAGKQVILRPRLDNSPKKKLASSPMGSAQSMTNNEGENNEPVVYYYDPSALQSSSSSTNAKNGNGEMEAPELTLPETVYDSSGHPLKLEALHANGRNQVYLEIKPKAVWGSDLSGVSDKWSTLQTKFNGGIVGGSGSGAASQSQDQLIVLFTVATMAVMVGALVAQRLRSKKMLESCLHPELDEEDWDESLVGDGSLASPRKSVASSFSRGGGGVRNDKKYDVDTGRSVGSTASNNTSGSGGLNSGFGALLGSRNNGGGYGTNENGGGGLHWRGDMEKFDV
mmetsp:Transcript_21029/g.45608  ORF Transcript_21029/g.45608 Transcript_21029/m.45608 type:complete len:590 (-) Transcript_21029:289-2058(-)